MSSSEQESDVVTAPPARRGAYNEADLRYLRGALLALEETRRASHVAAAWASDPRVRALARRARATQAETIRAITSMLLGWGRLAGGVGQPRAITAVSPPATSDLRSLDGLELDRRFIEILVAHAEASLAWTRMEMIEGFDGSTRRLAEDTSTANWRELAALSLLEPAPGHVRAPAPPLQVV